MLKKITISQEEYERTESQSLAARELLEDERFQFLRDYIQSALTYCEETILNNTIREVQEVTPITDKITRIFKLPKKVQVDELTGRYKWIKQFQADLEYFATLKTQLDGEVEKGLVKYEGGVGKDVSG